MKLKESALEASCGVSNSDIEELFQEINIIDSMQKLNRKDCDKASEWKSFISMHCKISHYSFQVKKCSSTVCEYCKTHPARTPDFKNIHFLPDPEPTSDNQHYVSFDDLYGKKVTTDSFRPSFQSQDPAKEADTTNC